jgi:CheY-like chemotaxis protein
MEAPVSTAVPNQIDPGDSSNREKLQGWKEIASELGRSVRTVQRWERTLGLPVRRGKDARAEVFVFKDELQLWLLEVAAKDGKPEQAGVVDGELLQSSINKGHSRLLFVDDEPRMMALLPVILRRFGFTVTVAPNVPKALEELRRQVFDVLFCNSTIEREGAGHKVIRAMQEVNPQCVTVIRRPGPPALDGGDQMHRVAESALNTSRGHSAKLRSA